MINYNVTSLQQVISAKELESRLQKQFPAFRVNYRGDTSVSENMRGGYSTMKEFNDDCARKEWGWAPQYDTPEAIFEIFQKDLREYPVRYGLA